jgi:hypothetical protein
MYEANANTTVCVIIDRRIQKTRAMDSGVSANPTSLLVNYLTNSIHAPPPAKAIICGNRQPIQGIRGW